MVILIRQRAYLAWFLALTFVVSASFPALSMKPDEIEYLRKTAKIAFQNKDFTQTASLLETIIANDEDYSNDPKTYITNFMKRGPRYPHPGYDLPLVISDRKNLAEAYQHLSKYNEEAQVREYVYACYEQLTSNEVIESFSPAFGFRLSKTELRKEAYEALRHTVNAHTNNRNYARAAEQWEAGYHFFYYALSISPNWQDNRIKEIARLYSAAGNFDKEYEYICRLIDNYRILSPYHLDAAWAAFKSKTYGLAAKGFCEIVLAQSQDPKVRSSAEQLLMQIQSSKEEKTKKATTGPSRNIKYDNDNNNNANASKPKQTQKKKGIFSFFKKKS